MLYQLFSWTKISVAPEFFWTQDCQNFAGSHHNDARKIDYVQRDWIKSFKRVIHWQNWIFIYLCWLNSTNKFNNWNANTKSINKWVASNLHFHDFFFKTKFDQLYYHRYLWTNAFTVISVFLQINAEKQIRWLRFFSSFFLFLNIILILFSFKYNLQDFLIQYNIFVFLLKFL